MIRLNHNFFVYYSKVFSLKKLGKPFSHIGLTYYNPLDDIIETYLTKKMVKSTFARRKATKKVIMAHLKSLQDYIIQVEGINLPQQLGKLQVMGFPFSGKVVDWKITNELSGLDNFTKGPRKFIYRANEHTNGLSYKLYYRTYFNTTKGIRYALYASSGLWTIKSGRLIGQAIKNKINESVPNYELLINQRDVIPINKRNDKQRIDW